MMLLHRTSFILNFSWKARKITLKKRDRACTQACLCLPQAGVVRFRYSSRKIPEKERELDADRDGKKN
jgi:hypothetical protein